MAEKRQGGGAGDRRAGGGPGRGLPTDRRLIAVIAVSLVAVGVSAYVLLRGLGSRRRIRESG